MGTSKEFFNESKPKKASKKRQPREDRIVIHKTKVRIDLVELRKIVADLKADLELVGTQRETHEQRSKFHSWNTVNKFLQEHDNGEDDIIIDAEGGVAGASARVYYFPSITSLCKQFRKCIKPLNKDNVFLFFDLKAAEFFMNCVFCGEQEAVRAYQAGEDIYLHYSHIFPEGTTRKVKKETLIANMYGVTPYRVAMNCGITEFQARNLLSSVAKNLPAMERAKFNVIARARKVNAYFCPKGFNQNELCTISYVKEGEEFSPLLALSAYVQSALGMWMAEFIHRLEKKTSGTILTVFDSVLFEVKKEKVGIAKEWINQSIAPFRAGGIFVGDSFYDAYIQG